jgi:hypothetical protein
LKSVILQLSSQRRWSFRRTYTSMFQHWFSKWPIYCTIYVESGSSRSSSTLSGKFMAVAIFCDIFSLSFFQLLFLVAKRLFFAALCSETWDEMYICFCLIVWQACSTTSNCYLGRSTTSPGGETCSYTYMWLVIHTTKRRKCGH